MRFPFGKNWRSFLAIIDEQRIQEARRALCASLGRQDLRGWRVLDIGSGSGLSSLAMHQLGAQVVSFDYDPESVSCTAELRRLYGNDSPDWTVLQGSALNSTFMSKLGKFDLVYSWGVLHHTGAMWQALELAQQRVAPGGVLLIALYNDQGIRSRGWRRIKQIYCSNAIGRALVSSVFFPLFFLYTLLLDIGNLEIPGNYIRNYALHRGMSIMHDWRDWLGGYPFEVASSREIMGQLGQYGFSLQRQTLTRGWGCNEFVWSKCGIAHGN